MSMSTSRDVIMSNPADADVIMSIPDTENEERWSKDDQEHAALLDKVVLNANAKWSHETEIVGVVLLRRK